MAYQSRNPFPEECANGINQTAASQMYIGDVYLTLAHYFTGPAGMPPFVMFFENVADVKLSQSKEFLRLLRRREGMVRIPFIERANIEQPGTPEKVLTYVVNLEDQLTRILEDLKTTASQAGETQLVKFVKDLMTKQERQRRFLERQISDLRKLEEYKQQRKLSENPPEPSVSAEDSNSAAAQQVSPL
ncbi:PREDICTED: ferritin-1 heavy chain-like [Chinchilla lanigera]|uniref:ferritin-1 heavy chain-like n=1 Tax=Chinchilla lanigera TaxID=34839 RepID=UPI00038F0A34|nr:PREDICTED: ferritin-1 heavy chain-like [Chinchilla lanigera]